MDGRLVASAAVDRTIKLWSLSDARLLRTFDGVHGIEALAFSPDGPVLAAADDNLIALFDVRTGATIRRVAACDDVFAVRMLLSDFGVGEPSRVIALPFNPSGKFLASACDGDASVKAWDFATGREIRRFGGPSSPGASAANTRADRDVVLGDAGTAGFRSLAFDSGGRRLAAGSADHSVRNVCS